MDCEKYSLRQREKRRLRQGANTKSPGYNSDNSSECLHNIFLCQKTSAGANAKLKTKAAPLSKYRRKTANARERTRMREINSAFENLRHCVPACITSEDVGPSSEKLTKITTLRLAMKYIKVLSEVLLDPQRPDYRSICDSISYRPSDKAPNDSKRRQREKSEDQKPNAAKTSSVVGKRRGKKGKLIQYDESESTLNHPCFETSPSSNSSSAYASLSPSYESSASPSSNYSHGFESNIMGHNCNSSHCRKSTSDLSTFMLESDGESLNPSERWPSPLRSSRNVPSMPNDLFECSPSDMPSLENPLELSLRLMEPPTDSVAFSPIRVPCSNSPCLAPLMNFESFDLFHPDDIGDHGALDLFLT